MAGAASDWDGFCLQNVDWVNTVKASSMLRRTVPFIAALLFVGATACTSKSDTDEAVRQDDAATSADATDDGASSESEDERVTPRSLDAREVEEVEGVLTKTALDEGEALEGTWSDCALEGTLADLEGQKRSPLRRLLVHEDHLYAVAEYEGNRLEIQGFEIDLDAEDGCELRPWTDFGDNGELDLGSGIADLSFVGEHLVATGIETTLYDLEGERVGTCDELARMTRVRGRLDSNQAIVRKNGGNIRGVSIKDGSCELQDNVELAGEEDLGMRIVPVSDDAFYATLQVDRVPNSLAYLKDNKVVWRYFPGDDENNERISLITELATMQGDVVALRSLQKTIDIIDNEGARRLHVDLNDDADLDRMAVPDKVAVLDDEHILVVLRHHITADEVEKYSLRVLTVSDEDAS